MRRLVLLLPALLAACAGGLDARVTPAMDGCVAARNPVFVAGNGATALDVPLPAGVDSMARELAYDAAFQRFRDIATEATTQAVLVCALELGAHSRTAASRTWLRRYERHPDAPVQAAARTLLVRFPPL
ncbi:MAG: hypothetical protein ACK53A_01235 [Gemmatimonadota bacterium]|jgi:hypothetical protein|nr:hypothetical protein [Gemmatimonadota bacterium]